MSLQTWVILGYNIQANPSKNRVYIWRKLKEFGAVYFRPSVAILPYTKNNLNKFKTLSYKIKDMGGEASIAEIKYIDKKDEEEIIQKFKNLSEKEYKQLILEHNKDKKTQEVLLEKKRISKRLKAAHSRDFFKASSANSIKQALEDLMEDIGELF